MLREPLPDSGFIISLAWTLASAPQLVSFVKAISSYQPLLKTFLQFPLPGLYPMYLRIEPFGLLDVI